jgi:hypothetical protein
MKKAAGRAAVKMVCVVEPAPRWSADQAQLQSTDPSKIGITSEHHGFWPNLQATGRLQGIRRTQTIGGSQSGG